MMKNLYCPQCRVSWEVPICKLKEVQYLKTGIFKVYKQICPSCGAVIGIDSKREEYEE